MQPLRCWGNGICYRIEFEIKVSPGQFSARGLLLITQQILLVKPRKLSSSFPLPVQSKSLARAHW